MLKKIGISAIILGIVSLLVAANYDSKKQRQSASKSSYAHLLSNAYRVISEYEGKNGTYSHVDFFQQQSKKAKNQYNPRPLTTRGIVNNKKSRRTLRHARFELERFMNGYAGRMASANVAMMHAAYDCRVKNIEVNYVMDRTCEKLFNKNRVIANKVITNFLNRKRPSVDKNLVTNPAVNNKNLPKRYTTMKSPAVKRNKKIRFTKNNNKKAFVNKTQAMKLKQLQKPKKKEDIIKPVIIEKQEVSRQKLKPLVAPQKVAKVSQDLKTNALKKAVKPKVEKKLEKEMPKDSANLKTNKLNEENKKFNPLDYIHPSLRRRATSLSKYKKYNSNSIPPKDVLKKDTPKQTPVSYGIKPTSKISLPNINAIKGQQSYYKPNIPQKVDYTATSSIKPNRNVSKKAVKAQIPFSTLLNLTKTGDKHLNFIASQLKHFDNRLIKIIGHADQGRNSAIDLKMSLKRANKIKAILKKHNPNLTIMTQALGSSEPLSGLNKYDDRNRRVEIILQ